MNLIQKIRMKKKVNKAIEEAIKPIWFVTYVLDSGFEGTLRIPADSEGKALTIATEKLNEKGYGWSITSTSCI